MRHKEIQNEQIETFLKNPIIQEAAKLMVKSKIGFLVVEDFDENIMIGTIAEHDVAVEVISKNSYKPEIKEVPINIHDMLAGKTRDLKKNNEPNENECIKKTPIVHDKNGNDTIH